MKIFKKKKKKTVNKEKYLIIKSGQKETRVYPKETLLVTNLERSE